MIQTRTLAVLVALLVVGGLTAQVGAVPGVTAQQESPLEQAANTGVTVDSLTAPQSVAPNSTADVAATVTNNQNTAVTESVEFRFDGAVVDRTLVTLESDESATVQFSADTTGIEPGDYRHGVFTSDDGQVAAVTISDSFTLESLDAPTNATAGDNITVDATVANPNDLNTTQTVEFRLGGQPLASESVSLDANESGDVTFTVDTTGVEPDTYIHSVFTRDDGAFAEITIEPAADVPEEPPANETEEPPADETEEPPANETEEPPANETEEPPADETEEPPADETEEPPANETEEPPANETDEPPADETEEPPANETEEPPADETEEPPANETEEPPADETEEPPADETEEPPANETEEGDEGDETDGTDNATEENATTES
ncbi:CARDB protein [Haloarcula vallismortis]|uniref:CARDB protein n=2 Tax=Haloarcula vallismortis TaxID=28442 RepID=A0A1H2SBN3_HALVA|nr:CARDB domain-containing protein [Haloarcula vallismortis]SDW29046.1 CARDB protein [Haloarcula vallismortis]